MAEKQILGFATGDAPRNRKTKDSERFTLLAVNATFDGSGASGDFVPAVVILSDSGDVVGRFPTDVTMPAGDSAEVTFAPFLSSEEDFVASGQEFVAAAVVSSVAASTTTPLPWLHASGATLLDYSVPAHPSFVHSGIYAASVYVRAQGPTPTTLSWSSSLSIGNSHGLGAIPLASNVWGTNLNPMNSYSPLASVQVCAAGDVAIIVVANPAGATRDYDFAGVIQRLA